MDCEGVSDSELVSKILTEPSYFECLVVKFEMPLRRYVRRITNFQPNDVEEVLQESFLLIYKNLNNFDQKLKLSSWIYRIVHNKSIDCLRKKNARPLVDLEIESVAGLAADSLIEINSLDERIEAKHQVSELIQIVKELPDQSREVIYLRFWEDMDYQEISDILRIPTGTVGSIINRFKKLLQSRAFTKFKKEEEK